MEKELTLEEKLKKQSLIEARKRLGLTQSQVAKAIGITQTYYSFIESMSNYPSIQIQEKICEFYSKSGEPLCREYLFPSKTRKNKKREIPILSFSEVSSKELIYTHVEEELLNKLNEDLPSSIEKAFETLTPREEEVVRLYFGFDDKALTLEEIGTKFNLTRERARQIKEKAIKRLGHKSRILKDYI